jgi:phosphoglycerate dehydrogenase-like enzyme
MSLRKVLVLGDPAAKHLRPLDCLSGAAELCVTRDESKAREFAADAEILLCDLFWGRDVPALFPWLRSLRWLHSVSAGVDHMLFAELIESEVLLTNGRGAFKRALAEFVIASALHFAKDLPRLVRNQREGHWEQYDMQELHGQVMGIVGYGEIGRATAALAKAFGMRVLGLRRRPESSGGESLVDEMVPRERLLDLMAQSDYVVVAAALTPETRAMIGAPELAAMKPTGVLVNVGRGAIVSEPALLNALRERRIRGAALDVFEVEPLPARHPFYRLDNVLLSPHTADHVEGWLERGVEVFLDNFTRYQQGETLLNIVDKRAGY